MSFSGKYADVYDALYHDKDYAREVAFVEALLSKHAAGPVRRILDLGCGTGRHDVALAQRGYWLDGVDRSPEMLAHAEARRAPLAPSERDALSFHAGDIRTLDMRRRYDAVLSLFHVMSYQASDADVLAALGVARRHLDRGGVFLFDFWHGPAVVAQGPLRREKRVENGHVHAVRRTQPVWDKSRDLVRVNYELEIMDKSSGTTETVQEEHVVRYFFCDRLVEMAEQSGFSLAEQGDWLTGLPPSDGTFSAYFVLKAR